MKIAIAVDHAGMPLLETVVTAVEANGHEAQVVGWSGDYPDIALAVSREILDGDADRGILICGSGAGVAIAASKVTGIRAACAHDHYTAAQCVTHDDVNVLCLGARVVGSNVATDLVDAFVSVDFSNEDRHVRRLGKVALIEREGTHANLDDAAPIASFPGA
ncbi:MAG: RpiB/LacA/LacB family sugar-phosphate isomerase [Solirubrobacteraceae bacterium]|nr:RpiB/LacA/LacB family sugar-phosphate isomerase [Solirubrobacteraceae bacterium]